MARVSKYQNFEGQSFNIKGLEVQVVRYHREVRISKKTGKKYYAYRLDVQLEGYTDILEISTASWKKQSFIKRLQKISVNKMYTNVYNYLPVVYNPIRKDFLNRTLSESWERLENEVEYFDTKKDVHKWFKKYAKYYHPDFLGRNLSPDEQECFEALVCYRDEAIEILSIFEA